MTSKKLILMLLFFGIATSMASAQQVALEAYNKERDAKIAAEKSRDSLKTIVQEQLELIEKYKEKQKADSVAYQKRKQDDSTSIALLQQQLDEANKQVEELEPLKGQLKKVTAERDKLQENDVKTKDLKDQIKSLKDASTKLATCTTEKATLEATCNKEKTTLNEKITELDKQVTKYKSDADALPNAKKEIERLTAEVTQLKQQVSNKEGSLADASKEIQDLKNSLKEKEAKIEQLTEQKETAEKQERAALEAKKTAEKERDQANQEKNTARSLLKERLTFAVNYLINSSDYNDAKADELIKLCEATDANSVPNLSSMKNNLMKYKKLCEAMNQAKAALGQAYQRANVTATISSLSSASTFNTNQRKDITHYKALLNGYCKATQLCHERFKRAESFLPNLPNNASKIMKQTLSEVDDEYSFLRNNLKKKQGNPNAYRKNPFAECQ